MGLDFAVVWVGDPYYTFPTEERICSNNLVRQIKSFRRQRLEAAESSVLILKLAIPVVCRRINTHVEFFSWIE